MTPTFSIVIPVYNTEQYLQDCLASIASQSYTDFEVIMVDDGSTDGSAAICKEYAEHDSRFIYHHKENGGVSCARNVGIEMARGEWLFFVDSDDILTADSLAIFAKMCGNSNVDMAMGTYILDSYIPKECYRESKTFDMSLGRSSIMELMFLIHTYNYQGYVWNKVFRSRIVKESNLRFDTDVYYNEDRLFCVQYICRMTGNARFTSLPVYRYFKRQSGAMGCASHTYNPKLMTEYESSVKILRLLESGCFPDAVVKLGYDRLIDSYDILRHTMRNTQYEHARAETKMLKERVVAEVGRCFYIGNRIRRFLSKQYYNVFKKRITVNLS